jgi:hypothetical protein
MNCKVSSDWLPSYTTATEPVLEIFKMAGYFLDSLVHGKEYRGGGLPFTVNILKYIQFVLLYFMYFNILTVKKRPQHR